jgi:GDP-L-fucose synthase
MVGAALMRRMAGEGAVLLTVPHAQLDLRRQSETEDWIARNRPEFILIAAAKVGGILANDTYTAQFLTTASDSVNIVAAAQRFGAKGFSAGSSCITRLAPQAIPKAVYCRPLRKPISVRDRQDCRRHAAWHRREYGASIPSR